MIFHKSWHFLHEIYPGKAMQLNLHSFFNILTKASQSFCVLLKICVEINVPEHFLQVPVRWGLLRFFVKIYLYSVRIPGRPWDRSTSSDSTLIHGRQWRENVCPACHVLHHEGKDLHLQKLGAGHCQNEVSYSLERLYSYFVLFFELILI